VACRVNTGSRGFTMVEMACVLGVVMILFAMAIPPAQSALASYQLSSAVTAVTGAIQSTRYKTVQNGCPYTLAFIHNSLNYQVATETPPPGTDPPLCVASFGPDPDGPVIPFASPTASIALNTDLTLQFGPNGTICAPGSLNCGTTIAGPPFCFYVVQSPVNTVPLVRKITVSGVGNVTVTQAPAVSNGC
jgi:type II secretory pathway pseudopilin PulG